MLLSSHIKGFVENPGYYFEKDDAERRRHLDLLLMVQGWRRFGIRQPEIVEPYEKSQMIVGEVNKYTPLDQEDGFVLVVTFYNNSRQTSLSVEAEGQAPDGTLLWGQKGME